MEPSMMREGRTAEEKLAQMKEQNGELVRTAQFWRLQYKKIEQEKLTLMKENNDMHLRKKRYYRKIHKRCEQLNELVCHTIRDLLQVSTYVQNVNDLVNEYDEPHASRTQCDFFPFSGSPQTPGRHGHNVHHVRPMIQGITLKTPVLRVSKTDVDSFYRSGRLVLNGTHSPRSPQSPRSPRSSRSPLSPHSPHSPRSPSRVQRELTASSIGLRRLTVSLSHLSDCDQNVIIRKSPRKRTSEESSAEASASVTNEMTNLEDRIRFSPCELSVSLSRIDPQIKKYQKENCQKNESREDESFDRRNNTCNESSRYSEKDSTYEDDVLSEDMGKGDCLKYSSRLECIIEESENDSVSLSVRTNSKNVTKEKSSPEIEDPLEGPSWRYEGTQSSNMSSANEDLSNEDKPLIYVTSRKKKTTQPDESLFDTSSIRKDAEQVPDSTTVESKDENTDLSICHSTPKPPKTEASEVQDCSSPILSVKPKSSKGSSVEKSKPTKSKEATKSRVKKVLMRRSRGSLSVSSPIRLSNKKSSKSKPKKESMESNSTRESGTSTASSGQIESETSARPKRGERKVYTEMPLGKKLRRS